MYGLACAASCNTVQGLGSFASHLLTDRWHSVLAHSVQANYMVIPYAAIHVTLGSHTMGRVNPKPYSLAPGPPPQPGVLVHTCPPGPAACVSWVWLTLVRPCSWACTTSHCRAWWRPAASGRQR